MEKEEEDALSSLFGDSLTASGVGKEIKVSSKQEQIHDLLFSREIGWQEIIYDLINTEQLDPWDIDLTLLTNKYLEKIQRFEEENYFVSSKVLLAAALLLRIKSEILLSRYIKSIDEILFGKKEKEIKFIEKFEFDEDSIPSLVPKSPVPRFRKVSLRELVESLNKAIITENRRIKKEVMKGNAFREAAIVLPKRNYLIHEKIKEIYEQIVQKIKDRINVSFFEISGENKEEKIDAFLSVLYLDNQRKIWIEQKEHFGEILISLKRI